MIKIRIRKSYLFTLVFISILIIGFLTLSGFNTEAQDNQPQGHKYYKSIVIEKGDSLWSIAEEYMSEEYEGIEEYIKELKSMNGLKGDTIHSGQNLVVAYYSFE